MVEVRSNDDAMKAKGAKKRLDSSFFKKGLTVAILSGMSYGLYTAFITVAMGKGIWADWNSVLSNMAKVFLLGVLGAGLNDLFSAFWAIIMAVKGGKFRDFWLTIKSKPGVIMITAALVGGPIAGVAYIIAIQMAGPIVIPIAALNVAVGAILGRIFFKQPLTARMILGVIICIGASFMIGLTSLTGEGSSNMALGIVIALIAAIGWGFEGTIAGFGTSMIDYEIGITIRQLTSGLTNLFILLPILSIIEGGGFSIYGTLLSGAFTDGPSLIFFVISGFFTLYAFSLWYKGNSMCGAALGMACNGAYSFWGPFFSWLIIGVFMKQAGFDIPAIAWVAALVMAVGIVTIATNPLDFFKKKEDVQ